MALGISDAVELVKRISDLAKAGITLELQERIAELREAVLNAKDDALALREENLALRNRLAQEDRWEARAAKYELVRAPGSAYVYHTSDPPEHFACPKCFEARKVSILQDMKVTNGNFRCPDCGSHFSVNPVQHYQPGVHR